MELELIVKRIAEAIPIIDQTTTIQNQNRRHKRPYIKGVPTLWEPQFVSELIGWWRTNYPTELMIIDEEFSYPNSGENCDIVLTGKDCAAEDDSFEWAIEIKYLRLVGNNGANNDYVMQKCISPYLKDRSLVHDVEKLDNAIFAKKKAVIFYGFEYDEKSSNRAKECCNRIKDTLNDSEYYVLNPEKWIRTGHISKKMEKDLEDGEIDEKKALDKTLKLFLQDINNIPKNMSRVVNSATKDLAEYSLKPIVEIVNDVFQARGFSTGKPIQSTFSGMKRHPSGCFGRVVGWEIT